MGFYSGKERLLGSMVAAYAYSRGSSQADGAKLSCSPSRPQVGKTTWRG